MSLRIKSLYHWSPSENRKSILQDGLKIVSPSLNKPDGYFSYICLGTTPSSAWGLIPVDPVEYEKDSWDLWQVSLSDSDHIDIRGDHVPYVREIRVNNSIPADRVWWVGKRKINAEIN